jgi:hypothetical protein
MSVHITVEVAPGELLDKLSILSIKRERIVDREKRENVEAEFGLLYETWEQAVPPNERLNTLYAALRQVNEDLWEIEDAIRECERRRDFGKDFVRLARAVYHRNDRRAYLKRQVNELLGSRIVEEKSYAAY